MWYDKFTFQQSEKGLKEEGLAFLHNPLNEEELIKLKIDKFYPEFVGLKIPKEIILQNEHLELLYHSNGGLIVNGEREFGFFALSDIKDFYFGYGFMKWTPLFLPIAFNGGGVFYAYDYRNTQDICIIAVSSSNLDYDCTAFLGKSLKEILSKTTNIEDKLYKIY